ncbi:MAG TPA: ABC transporter permease [Holophagaceae bacterium]|nr:ABC transporter permease [Holophagaceae bacterium]
MGTFDAFVARRYLRAQRKGAFVRVMVRFATGGIALGVFAMVVTMALMNGFREEIQKNLFSATAHFTVAHLAGDIPDTAKTLADIRATPGVVAASPIRIDKGLLRSPASGAPPEPVLIKAVDPASAHGTSSIFDSATVPVEQLKEGQILIGKELAEKLDIRAGDTITVAYLRLDLSLGGAQPKLAAYKVAGFFQSHISDFDRGWAFIHIEDAERLARTDQAEMIEVRTTGIDAIGPAKKAVLDRLGPAFVATDLRETNKPLFAALTVEKWIFTAILALIVLVAAFNIVASLVLLVTEKRRDLGVMLAFGATPDQVARIFVRQGLWLGAVGTAIGLALSVPLCLLADHYQWIHLPAAVYDFITYIPFRLRWPDLLLAAAFPMLVAWFSARRPARRAANLDPVDALRSE